MAWAVLLLSNYMLAFDKLSESAYVTLTTLVFTAYVGANVYKAINKII
jgi:hypothetical protein